MRTKNSVTVSFSLPKAAKAYIDRRVGDGSVTSASALIAALIDKERQEQEERDARIAYYKMALGPAIERGRRGEGGIFLDNEDEIDAYFDDVIARGAARHGIQPSPPRAKRASKAPGATAATRKRASKKVVS